MISHTDRVRNCEQGVFANGEWLVSLRALRPLCYGPRLVFTSLEETLGGSNYHGDAKLCIAHANVNSTEIRQIVLILFCRIIMLLFWVQ